MKSRRGGEIQDMLPEELANGLEFSKQNFRLQSTIIEQLLHVLRIISDRRQLETRPGSGAEVVDAAL